MLKQTNTIAKFESCNEVHLNLFEKFVDEVDNSGHWNETRTDKQWLVVKGCVKIFEFVNEILKYDSPLEPNGAAFLWMPLNNAEQELPFF